MNDDTRRAVGGIAFVLIIIAFLLGSIKRPELDDGWVETGSDSWARGIPQNDPHSIGYRRGANAATTNAAWIVGAVAVGLFVILVLAKKRP